MRLGPVADALLDDAEADAARLLDQAERDTDSIRTSAQADVSQQLARVQDRAETSARAHHQQLLTQSRRQASAIIMEAQEAARVQLITQLRHDAMRLRDDPRYAQLLDGLEAAARRQLGPDTIITRDPTVAGGIIGSDGDRNLEYTLPALAERALGSLGRRTAELWT
jgi:vacuolar-type H+-ATPase subunit E/Vma4